MRPAIEVMPESVEAWREGESQIRTSRGAPVKAWISLRLSPGVIAPVQSGGDWQARIDQALMEERHRHPGG